MGYLHVVLLLGVHLCVSYAEVMTYCDLSQPESRENPNIVLDTVENQARFAYPREQIQDALARDSAARDFVRSLGIIANASHRAHPGQNPSRIPAQTRPPGRKYDAPMVHKPMCESFETFAIGMFREDGAFCRIIEGQEVPYTQCSNAECDKENGFPYYEKYYCSAESFVMNTAMVFCYAIDGSDQVAPDMTMMSFDTPVQCTCRKFSCNLDGMMK